MTAAPPRRPYRQVDPPAFSPLETVALVTLAMVLLVGVVVWVTGWVLTGGQLTTSLGEIPEVLGRLLADPAAPAGAWPAPDQARMPGPAGFYLTATALLSVPTVAVTVVMLRVRDRHRRGEHDARWARRGDLAPLAIRRATGDRLVLGRHHPSGRLLACEPSRSLLVLGPSRSGKTTGLAIPAILEWDGPVIATSVKTDLVSDTAGWRATHGRVQLYDPTGATGLSADTWSPLAGCISWMGAVRTAHTMAAVVKTTGTAGGLTDGDFWYASAAKLLAPLLYAAAAHDLPIADVVRWLNTQEARQVTTLLDAAGVPQASEAFVASTRRADNQKSSIYTTAETVLAAYEDPVVAASAATSTIDADRLLDGANTVYLCAPRDDQRRLRPLFVGLLQQLLSAASCRAAALPGGRLDRPLLVVLDEAANIAPLPDLDELASTAMGIGITLVTVFQDLAQITARYGPRAPTIVNNHAGMLVLRGMRDLDALRTTSDLLGRHTPPEHPRDSRPPTAEALLPAHALRGLPEGRAVGIYQHLPPFQVDLRPHYATRHLRHRSHTPPPHTPPPHPTPPPALDRHADRQLETPEPTPRGNGVEPDRERSVPARRVGAAPQLADVLAHADALATMAAEHDASNLRLIGSVASGTAVAGSDINLLVDIPPARRLLHLSSLATRCADLLGRPTTVLALDMLHTPETADHAIQLHAQSEVPT
jgi:type IV secretion system protein VirD4